MIEKEDHEKRETRRKLGREMVKKKKVKKIEKEIKEENDELNIYSIFNSEVYKLLTSFLSLLLI